MQIVQNQANNDEEERTENYAMLGITNSSIHHKAGENG